MEAVEDPRVREGICGVTHIGCTGIEWICVIPPHAKVYNRRTSSKTHKKGDLIFNTNKKVDQHYFVNRWPNRQKDVNET